MKPDEEGAIREKFEEWYFTWMPKANGRTVAGFYRYQPANAAWPAFLNGYTFGLANGNKKL